MLLKRIYEAVVHQRNLPLELNVLTESLFFASFYVLTIGLAGNSGNGEKLKQTELYLRQMIIQAYEDLYNCHISEKYRREDGVRDRGIMLDSTHSSVFVSILDLILLSRFDKYAVKRSLFLKADRLLSLHNPSTSYPCLPEGYFASLPMTRMDETVLRALIQKKQPIDPSVENSSQRDILLSIVKAITPKTVSSNSGSFSIDYCA